MQCRAVCSLRAGSCRTAVVHCSGAVQCARCQPSTVLPPHLSTGTDAAAAAAAAAAGADVLLQAAANQAKAIKLLRQLKSKAGKQLEEKEIQEIKVRGEAC